MIQTRWRGKGNVVVVVQLELKGESLVYASYLCVFHMYINIMFGIINTIDFKIRSWNYYEKMGWFIVPFSLIIILQAFQCSGRPCCVLQGCQGP